MYLISKFVLRKRHGIVDERRELKAALLDWSSAATLQGGRGPFLGGASPSVADACMFGALRSIAEMQTWRDLREEIAREPDFESFRLWYREMERAVGPSACAGSLAVEEALALRSTELG